jgi:hypothetical protein
VIMFIIDLPARGRLPRHHKILRVTRNPVSKHSHQRRTCDKASRWQRAKGSKRPTAECIGKHETYQLLTYRAQLHHRIVTR